MTTKIEKGAGAEAREPLTRPADAELSRRHLRGDLASIWTPSKVPVPGAAPGVRKRFRFTGGWVRWFPINRYGCRGRNRTCTDAFKARWPTVSRLDIVKER